VRTPAAGPRIVPFTSFAGVEMDPAVSPDGQQIAFTWSGPQGDNYDIYVKRVDSDTPLRLTRDAVMERCPAWSPDGSQIAFIRFGPKSGIYTVPALGGPERRLADINNPAFGDRYLDWSPNGKFLAVADVSPDRQSGGIYLLSLETGDRTQLTTAQLDDNSPAFSPDGREIVFTRWVSYYVSDLYVVPASGGEPKRLTFDSRLNRGAVWMPDGRSIVFSSERDGSPALWKISASGGTPEKIADAPGRDLITGISRQSSQTPPRLAFSENFVDTNIWEAVTTGDRSPTPLIASTRDDVAPDISPDGKRIAFASNRSGHWEIWVCDRDASNPLQLTAFHSALVGSPRWSPDGAKIAFDARPDGNGDIFVVDAQAGVPRRLTKDPSDEMAPAWSRDGRWIYFASNRTGSTEIWKLPSHGGGAAVQMTKGGGFLSQESPDGDYLYYSNPSPAGVSTTGIWKVPVNGGAAAKVVDSAFDRFWMPNRNGIFFVRKDGAQQFLEFVPFAEGTRKRLLKLEKPLEEFLGGMAVSADGRSIIYSQMDNSNVDIMLLENLR
jgi:Tol biopolymer transport system component